VRSLRRIGGLVVVAALVCASAACGGGGSSSSSTSTVAPVITIPAATTTTCKAGQSNTTANPCSGGAPAATIVIADAWKKFFNGATPVAQRVALLAGGQRFAATIKSLSTNPLATKTSATVSKVTITGPTTAQVTFTVYLAGAPVLANVKGTAVLQNGTWLVDAGSLCKLLALQGSPTPACSSAG
jgi:hypothetical protein